MFNFLKTYNINSTNLAKMLSKIIIIIFLFCIELTLMSHVRKLMALLHIVLSIIIAIYTYKSYRDIDLLKNMFEYQLYLSFIFLLSCIVTELSLNTITTTIFSYLVFENLALVALSGLINILYKLCNQIVNRGLDNEESSYLTNILGGSLLLGFFKKILAESMTTFVTSYYKEIIKNYIMLPHNRRFLE